MKVKAVLAAGSFLLWICLWVMLSFLLDTSMFPEPWEIVLASGRMIAEGNAVLHILTTMMRILAAFCIAFVAGTAAGIICGFNKVLDVFMTPVLNFFHGLPPILWAIPLLFLMGFGSFTPVLAISVIIFPVVTVTVREASRTIPEDLHELLKIFAPGKAGFLRELLFPHLTPALVTSAKLGLVLGLKASITAEFFTANNGLGFLIQTAYANGKITELYALGFLILILLFVFNRILGFLLSLIPFQRERRRKKELVLTARYKHVSDSPETPTGKKTPAGNKIPGIIFSHVGFSFGRQKNAESSPVFSGLSFRLSGKKIMVLSGDSGIGKTTLIKLAARLLAPDSGLVQSNRPFSFLFQDDRLLPWHTVAGNCALPLISAGAGKSRAYARAVALLSSVGLDGEIDKFPDELSGGMKRRACLARCFSRLPEALFLDEPFNGLQKKARIQLWNVFLDLWKKNPCPAIIVTHYPEEIPSTGDFLFYSLFGHPARLEKKHARRYNKQQE